MFHILKKKQDLSCGDEKKEPSCSRCPEPSEVQRQHSTTNQEMADFIPDRIFGDVAL